LKRPLDEKVPGLHTSYIALYDFVAENDSEITVSAGMQVNVLRKCDKSGNSEWWLVERGEGGDKGYIPESFLSQETISNTPKPEPDPPETDLSSSGLYENKNSKSTFYSGEHLSERKTVAHSIFYASPDNSNNSIHDQSGSDHNTLDKDKPSESTTAGASNVTYILEYDFEALNTGELDAKEGQLVTCLEDHDEKGNPEWWLVEYDGQRGYIPRDYLSRVNESQMC